MDEAGEPQMEILVGPHTITEVYGHAASVVPRGAASIGVQGASSIAQADARSWEESRYASSNARRRGRRAHSAVVVGFLAGATGTAALIWLLWELR
jgi:hypothetical protein